MILPDDLKTKLSLDEDVASSPKGLFRVSADKVAVKHKHILSAMPHSSAIDRDKDLANFNGLHNRNLAEWAPETPSINQGAITQLLEQISTMNERMDEFTSRIEGLNSKFGGWDIHISQQNSSKADACSVSATTSLFMSGLGSGTLIPNSSSSTQLNKDSLLQEEIMVITRGQHQLMNQLDNLSKLVHAHLAEGAHHARAGSRNRMQDLALMGNPLILMLAVASIGICLFKGLY